MDPLSAIFLGEEEIAVYSKYVMLIYNKTFLSFRKQ